MAGWLAAGRVSRRRLGEKGSDQVSGVVSSWILRGTSMSRAVSTRAARHTGNSLMQDAGVDQELRMREVGHADKSVNDRYTHPAKQPHLAAAEQTAALVRKARKAA
jgi:hypothetical protein